MSSLESTKQKKSGNTSPESSHQLIVNCCQRETCIATMEGGRLVEYRVEREERVVGSIFKGIVQNVLPGMDAAFVDIGLEKNAFLYVADILPEENSDASSSISLQKRSELRRRNIKDLLKPGQEIMVQVIKGPRGTKGARVTTRVNIPGRYVVLVPDGDHVAVSRNIESKLDRDKYKKIGEIIRPEGHGIIILAECEFATKQKLQAEMKFLKSTWNKVFEDSKKQKAPACIYRDQTLLYRTLREVFSDEVDKFIIDDPDEYEKVHLVANALSPGMKDKIYLYDKKIPIFDYYKIEKDLEHIMSNKIWLKSGAYLIIDEMEALTAIDVNTGKQIGSTSLSDTILRTNMEAADEISRQLRLRDMGGIIVIDFIDMDDADERKQLLEYFKSRLTGDKARTRVGKISSLGLLEITRKRTSESISEILMNTCTKCNGRGRVPSTETVALWIERDMHRLLHEEGDAFYVECNPEVLECFINSDYENVESLEHKFSRGIYLRANPDIQIQDYRIVTGFISEFDKKYLPYRRSQVIECYLKQIGTDTPQKLICWTSNGYCIELNEGYEYSGERVRVCLKDLRRSYAKAELLHPVNYDTDSDPSNNVLTM